MPELLGVPLAPALVLVAVAAGALAQAVTGMGFSLVAAPALVLVLGPERGVPTVLLLAVLASLVPLTRDWRHVRVPDATRLLAPTLAATPLVALALRGAETRWLALAAGTGIVASVALLASGLRSRRLAGPGGAVATGVGSATLNVVGGVGGPPVGLYAANADWPAHERRATLHAFFLVQNVVTALVLGPVLPGGWQVAALLAGTATGMALAPRIPVTAARVGVLAVSVAGGVGLVAGTV
jgi:uncharacterized membrane protein YfcA